MQVFVLSGDPKARDCTQAKDDGVNRANKVKVRKVIKSQQQVGC
jgi:hypothetical protein